jgi:hypothetical protein
LLCGGIRRVIRMDADVAVQKFIKNL